MLLVPKTLLVHKLMEVGFEYDHDEDSTQLAQVAKAFRVSTPRLSLDVVPTTVLEHLTRTHGSTLAATFIRRLPSRSLHIRDHGPHPSRRDGASGGRVHTPPASPYRLQRRDAAPRAHDGVVSATGGVAFSGESRSCPINIYLHQRTHGPSELLRASQTVRPQPVLLCDITGTHARARAQQPSPQTPTAVFEESAMRGLTGIFVLIRAAAPAREAGLDTTAIRSLVELELRRSRIPVLARGDERILLAGILSVEISSGPESQLGDVPIRMISTRLALMQLTQVVRDPRIRTFATTWDSGSRPSFTARAELQFSVEQLIRGQLTRS